MTTNDLRGVFGWYEFEEVAAKIINYLTDSSTDDPYNPNMTRQCRGVGKDKVFCAADIDSDPNILSMFAAAGWLRCSWYPTGLTISEDFIERLEEKGIKCDFITFKISNYSKNG